MGIPESQLETWAKQGSITGSADTYNLVKDVLQASTTPYAGRDYSVYLQGSYGNDTNIFAESDVDIVITLNQTWHQDVSGLSEAEKIAYDAAFQAATYDYAEFRRDVLTVLQDAYDSVKSGNKAIIVPTRANRRSTDVLVATQYRRYFKFNGVKEQSYDEGICFFDSKGNLIANYPRQHRENMTKRHQDSGNWLKPMVRIFKNARTKLVAEGVMEAGVAPSYYLEGLLYNAPLDCFGTNYNTSLLRVLQWMYETRDTSRWVTANAQYYLLWDGTQTAWPKVNYVTFKNAIISLWNEW